MTVIAKVRCPDRPRYFVEFWTCGAWVYGDVLPKGGNSPIYVTPRQVSYKRAKQVAFNWLKENR